MRYQYSYYLSSSIKFIQKNKIHSYQFSIKFFKTFTKLIILLSIDQFPHLEKFPQKERFDCVPIFTQCHRTFLQNGKTAVSRKSLKRVIRALENLLLTSLCILSHLPPYFPFTLPTPIFGPVYVCMRWQPLSKYPIWPREAGRRRKKDGTYAILC